MEFEHKTAGNARLRENASVRDAEPTALPLPLPLSLGARSYRSPLLSREPWVVRWSYIQQ